LKLEEDFCLTLLKMIWWLSVTTEDSKLMNCPCETFECLTFRPVKEFHNRMNKRLIKILTMILSCHFFF